MRSIVEGIEPRIRLRQKTVREHVCIFLLTITLGALNSAMVCAADGRKDLSTLTPRQFLDKSESRLRESGVETGFGDHDFVILFIPGILGSRLVRSSDGATIWGDNLDIRLEDLKLDPEDAPAEAEVLKRIKGLSEDYSLEVYGDFDRRITALTGGQAPLEFPYDWRQDIRDIARLLDHKLKEPDEAWSKRLYGKRLIIVAHSMGGVVAWYWKKHYYDPEDYTFSLSKMLLLGSPLHGSCEMLRMLLEGYGPEPSASQIVESLYHYLFKDLRSAAYTFPSVFELLPALEDGSSSCLTVEYSDYETHPMDLFSSDTWDKFLMDVSVERGSFPWRLFSGDKTPWGELTLDRETFLGRLKKNLDSARQFRNDLMLPQRATDRDIVFLYSRNHSTTRQIVVNAKSRVATLKRTEKGPGDGRVLFESAKIFGGRTQQLQGAHGELMRDSLFLDQLSDIIEQERVGAAVQALVGNSQARRRFVADGGLLPLASLGVNPVLGEEWSEESKAILSLNREILAARLGIEVDSERFAYEAIQFLESSRNVLEDATPVYEMVIEDAQKAPSLKVRSLQLYAQNLGERKDYLGAVRSLEVAERVAAEHPDQFQGAVLGSLYFKLAEANRMVGNIEAVTGNYQRAAEVFRSAAETEPIAMYNLGVFYETGRGVSRDLGQAAKWYRRAAERDYPWALTRLAGMYKSGDGVEKDLSKASELLRDATSTITAASDDYPPSLSGEAFGELGTVLVSLGSAAEADLAYKTARGYLQPAAEEGDVLAIRHFAAMSRDGLGESRNPMLAAKLFTEAAESGDSYSMVALGSLFERGKGVPRDEEGAIEWYKRAAELNDPAALLILGSYYENGRGVKKNLETALEYYRTAADLGSEDARGEMTRLEVLLNRGASD